MPVYKEHFPNANDFAMAFARTIVESHIICDDCLNPQTETVRSWGITADKGYVQNIEKRKNSSKKNF